MTQGRAAAGGEGSSFPRQRRWSRPGQEKVCWLLSRRGHQDRSGRSMFKVSVLKAVLLDHNFKEGRDPPCYPQYPQCLEQSRSSKQYLVKE